MKVKLPVPKTKAEKPASKKLKFKSANLELKHLLLDPNNYRFLDKPTYKRKIKTKYHLPAVQDATLRLLELDKSSYQLAELKKSIGMAKKRKLRFKTH